jgi:hypothetical protein
LPRIPVYNVTAQISGQAGSTSVPQISQAATSGAIASQTDSLSKGLQAISNVAANVVKLESERIIAKENIKYKTMLDTTEKLIQANFADQPELWMDYYENGFTVGEQYVPGRANIVSEIQNNKYKYDFINNSVLNQTEINNLAIREDLFEGYLKETKKQNLIAFEDTSKILGGDLGNSVNGDTPEFDTKLFLLLEELNKYSSGGGNNPVGFQQEVFELALSNALYTEYGNRKPEQNINLLPNEVTNSNILEIMKRMDDDVVRATFDKFSDEADETFKENNSVNAKKITEGKQKVNTYMELYDHPDTTITEKNEIAKNISQFSDVFFEEGEKLDFLQYHERNVETDFELQFNRVGNQTLADDLTLKFNERKISFAEVRKFFSELNVEQQQKLLTLKDERANENYTLASKAVKTYFGFSEFIQPNLDDETNPLSKAIIAQSTDMAIQIFNNRVLSEGKDLDFVMEIENISQQVIKTQKKRIERGLQVAIDNFAEFNTNIDFLETPINEINPYNVLEVINKTIENIQNSDLSKGVKNEKIFYLEGYDAQNRDLLIMLESFANE